jgi:Phosphoglycerol transferase and related proteins, alkaline phosphatase superfamily
MYLIDQGIEYAVSRLREAGKLSNTVIMIVGMNPRMDDVSMTSANRLSHYRTPLFLYGRNTNQTVNEVMGPADVIPTLISYFSFELDNYYLGTSAFAPGQNVVYFRDGSWISTAGTYDSLSQRFTISNIIYQTEFLGGYVDLTTQRIIERQRIATIILERNYFNQEAI